MSCPISRKCPQMQLALLQPKAEVALISLYPKGRDIQARCIALNFHEEKTAPSPSDLYVVFSLFAALAATTMCVHLHTVIAD